MDREKAIKGIRKCLSHKPCSENGCPYENECAVEHLNDPLLRDALAMLKELEPVPSEMEGGGYNWYPVCGACHGVIGDMDSYCKHCGTPVLKKEIKIHHMRGGVEIEETE